MKNVIDEVAGFSADSDRLAQVGQRVWAAIPENDRRELVSGWTRAMSERGRSEPSAILAVVRERKPVPVTWWVEVTEADLGGDDEALAGAIARELAEKLGMIRDSRGICAALAISESPERIAAAWGFSRPHDVASEWGFQPRSDVIAEVAANLTKLLG